jgi:hypothetical protein
MADYLATADLSDIATKDVNRLVGSIAKALAFKSPYIGLIKGGTWKNGISDTVRTATQEQAMPGDSLAVPTFYDDVAMCDGASSTESVATTEYSYSLGTKRGHGPKVCVKQGRAAFKDSYLRAENSLADLITQYINSDIRAQLYLRSGAKFVAAKGYSFEDLFTGGPGQISVPFAPIPAADVVPLSFKALHRLARYLNEVLLGEMFEGGKVGGANYRFVCGNDQLEYLRESSGVENKLVAYVQGGYKLGEVALKAFSFEESPAYRGISFGADQRPLRASTIVNGVPTLVNPVVGVATTKGIAPRANPAWIAAPIEVGFLIAQNSFERQVPEQFLGEGSFKFSPQLMAGQLDWHYLKDNGANEWGDFGYHKYQIIRAYRPIRPEHIIPIVYRRCTPGLGLDVCTSEPITSSLGSTASAL